MNDTFRTAPSNAPQASTEALPGGAGNETTSLVSIEVPFSQFEAVNNRTYTEKFFDLPDGNNAQIIEQFILDKIEGQNLKDSLKTYNDIINDIFSKLGIDENETNESKYVKVIKYIEMLSRDKTQEQKQRELLRRQKNEEKRKEDLRKKIIENNYEKAKEDRRLLRQKSEEMKGRIVELEKINSDALKEAQKTKEQYKTAINKLKEVKTDNANSKVELEKENNRLKALLEKTSQREQKLLLKQKQLKELI